MLENTAESQQKKLLAAHVANVIAELDSQKSQLEKLLADIAPERGPATRGTVKAETEGSRPNLEGDVPRSTIKRLIDEEKVSSDLRLKTCEQSLNTLRAKMQQLKEEPCEDDAAPPPPENDRFRTFVPPPRDKDCAPVHEATMPFPAAETQSDIFRAMGSEVFDDDSTETNVQLWHRRVISDNPPQMSVKLMRPCSNSVKDISLLRKEKKQLRISSLQTKVESQCGTEEDGKKKGSRESSCDVCIIF